jgi:hypothetical protein
MTDVLVIGGGPAGRRACWPLSVLRVSARKPRWWRVAPSDPAKLEKKGRTTNEHRDDN